MRPETLPDDPATALGLARPAGRTVVTDTSLRPLVDRLALEFMREGSVNALYRRISSACGRDGDVVYPNRLHALLSDDPRRSVNPATVVALKGALSRIDASLPPGTAEPSRAKALRARVLEHWRRRGFEAAPVAPPGSTSMQIWIEDAVPSLALPAAVVRIVLEEQALVDAPAAVSPSGAGREGDPANAPDWRFQDEARERTLRSLGADRDRKVGLVIPTGGGKTRVGIQIALSVLADAADRSSVVLWLTHRRFLGEQATRELRRALEQQTPDLDQGAVDRFASRVHMIMVGELVRSLEKWRGRIALVVVDEAHHAAAASYAPLFEHRPLKGLFLTATPVRTDRRAIGVDEIAYTISYRELFARRALIEPSFEEPLVMQPGGWGNANNLRDLADYLVERSQTEFRKTIVVAARTEFAEAMHAAVRRSIEEHATRGGSVLDVDDVGFIHGCGNSKGSLPTTFLEEVAGQQRGILISTMQMLGEGYDDPSVDAVVVTYPTTSMLQLMQAAGRGLRYAPGKTRTHVVQVKASPLAYHYEQRWLYQDISDRLHPRLVDTTYGSVEDLQERVADLLESHRVDHAVRTETLRGLAEVEPGAQVSVLLTGLPYAGRSGSFASDSRWSCVLAAGRARETFLSVFNAFSLRVGDVKFARDFLMRHLDPSTTPGGRWLCMRDMLTAMEYARREIDGESYVDDANRGYVPKNGTTWLTYVTYRFDPIAPAALKAFLGGAVNANRVLADYVRRPARWRAATKIDLPLGGSVGFILDGAQSDWLLGQRSALVARMRDDDPERGYAQLDRWRQGLPSIPIPHLLVERFDTFLVDRSLASHFLEIGGDLGRT